MIKLCNQKRNQLLVERPLSIVYQTFTLRKIFEDALFQSSEEGMDNSFQMCHIHSLCPQPREGA
jgi:hypothetical protein